VDLITTTSHRVLLRGAISQIDWLSQACVDLFRMRCFAGGTDLPDTHTGPAGAADHDHPGLIHAHFYCPPQKFRPSLSGLLFQAIFAVQPTENRRRFAAVTGRKPVPMDASRNLGLGWLRHVRSYRGMTPSPGSFQATSYEDNCFMKPVFDSCVWAVHGHTTNIAAIQHRTLRPITAHTGTAELCPRLMPSRFILEIKVVRFRPSRAAAPFRPPTTPSVCWRV
jgi:hypothetical protein